MKLKEQFDKFINKLHKKNFKINDKDLIMLKKVNEYINEVNSWEY
jgi:hypothetical protein